MLTAYDQTIDSNRDVTVEYLRVNAGTKLYSVTAEGLHGATVYVRNGEPRCGSQKCHNPFNCIHTKAYHSFIATL